VNICAGCPWMRLHPIPIARSPKLPPPHDNSEFARQSRESHLSAETRSIGGIPDGGASRAASPSSAVGTRDVHLAPMARLSMALEWAAQSSLPKGRQTGRLAYSERRDEWSPTFDSIDRPKVGRLSRKWSVGQTEVACVREMARCPGQIADCLGAELEALLASGCLLTPWYSGSRPQIGVPIVTAGSHRRANALALEPSGSAPSTCSCCLGWCNRCEYGISEGRTSGSECDRL